MNVLDILTIGSKIIDRVLPDPAQKAAAQLKLMELQQQGALAEMEADVKTRLAGAEIVKAEAQGEGVLQRNWRPVLMLTFGGLIVARWLGWSAPGISESEILQLWDIVQLGLGGYVIGRSAEKIAPTVISALKR